MKERIVKFFKNNVVRTLAVAALAGAALTATAPAAQAQRVFIGGGYGYRRPVYVPPARVYVAPAPVYGYYGYPSYEAWWRFHHPHEFYRRPY